ncbi:DUF6473 family protein [Falsihalocynthiibacter sp. SS001]|uniref:DUF6473 family protein n=1 Tax=Falsihalocynthiibacter sp. SS001 TaxID=3349698 RepID=UPI0036D25705
MAYENLSDGALDYLPCRYGKSKLLFRGPRRKTDGDYVAVIGGTETYGKFIEQPFSNLLEEALDVPAVNFGCVNAGADVFLNEPTILEACSKARVTVVQVMGAQNMSNRFYAVHPRRNDRFLKASVLMKTVFREIDFTEFHFTRHMLSTIKAMSEERFQLVETELKEAWKARMQNLLERIEGKTVVLWLDDSNRDGSLDLGQDPLFVDQSMIEAIRPYCTEVVEVSLSEEAKREGTEGMIFPDLEEPIAHEMMGLRAHQEVAECLAKTLRGML